MYPGIKHCWTSGSYSLRLPKIVKFLTKILADKFEVIRTRAKVKVFKGSDWIVLVGMSQ